MSSAKAAAAAGSGVGVSAEAVDTATALKRINTKLAGAGTIGTGTQVPLLSAQGGAGAGGAAEIDAAAERFVRTVEHTCVTADVATDSFSALVWDVTSAGGGGGGGAVGSGGGSGANALSNLVFGLFRHSQGLATLFAALQHKNWTVRLALLPVARSLALCDVMLCRALSLNADVLRALHATCCTAVMNGDAVTAHYAADILALVITANPKRVTQTLVLEFDAAATVDVVMATAGGAAAATPGKAAAAPTTAQRPLMPLVPMLCLVLSESAAGSYPAGAATAAGTAAAAVPGTGASGSKPPASKTAGDELLPSLAFRQTTQTFVLRALFFVLETLGLRRTLLMSGGAALTYLTHYALAIRNDTSSLLSVLSFVRISASLVRDSAQAALFYGSYALGFLARCTEWGKAAADATAAGAGAAVPQHAADAKAAPGGAAAVDPAVSSMANGIVQCTAEWRAAEAADPKFAAAAAAATAARASGDEKAVAAAAGAAADGGDEGVEGLDLGTESHANVWRVYCHNTAAPNPVTGKPCARVATEDDLSAFARCARCRLVTYCSPDCQRADWTAPNGGHKALCFANPQLAPASKAAANTDAPAAAAAAAAGGSGAATAAAAPTGAAASS